MSANTTQQQDDDHDFGPQLKRPREEEEAIVAEEPIAKKAKFSAPDSTQAFFAERLPTANMYELSYMHRDVVTHTLVTPGTDFVITASSEGIVKFWKKTFQDVEFVKQFQAHVNLPVTHMTVSKDGAYLVTISLYDQTAKVFDVINFDMIHVLKFNYAPLACCMFQDSSKQASPLRLAVAEKNLIHVYDLFNDEIVQPTLKIDNDNEDTSSAKLNTTAVPSNAIYAKPIQTLKFHSSFILSMDYNHAMNVAVSTDRKGVIEYWTCQKGQQFVTLPHKEMNQSVSFTSKLSQTDLFDLFKQKTYTLSVSFSLDGQYMACCGADQVIRTFNFKTGKLVLSLSMEQLQELELYKLDPLDLGKRMGLEKEIEKNVELAMHQIHAFANQIESSTDIYKPATIPALPTITLGVPPKVENPVIPNPFGVLFDHSGQYIMVPSMFGIQVIHIHSKQVVRLLGKVENTERFMNLSLFQGMVKMKKTDLIKLGEKKKQQQQLQQAQGVSSTLLAQAEMLGANNAVSIHSSQLYDPTVYTCAYKKHRFYLFTQREPSDDAHSMQGRDIFNEKPSKDEFTQMVLAKQQENKSGAAPNAPKMGTGAIIHTAMGDIHMKLFGDKSPKAVQNFTGLSTQGYYNQVTFHRVIRNFMIQTGDPTGIGTGGTSIWGKHFDDELDPSLTHNQPYMVSMANHGPCTNGSQFFITTVPTPWLTNKHTIFGEVTRGFEVVKAIEGVNTNPKNDRPKERIFVINIEILF